MSHSKFRYVVVLLFVLVLGAAFYFIDFLSEDKPYKVVVSDAYTEGTKVSLYDKLPNSFPEEFALADFELEYADEVKDSNGVADITVSFKSQTSTLAILNKYRRDLPPNGWTLDIDSTSPEVYVLKVYNDEDTFLVTISLVTQNKTMITIQYQK